MCIMHIPTPNNKPHDPRYFSDADNHLNPNTRAFHKGPMRSALRNTAAPIHRLHRRGIPLLLHKVSRIEPEGFQLADNGVDLARRIPLLGDRA